MRLTAQPSASTGNQPQCSATRRDGSPCRAQALPGRAYCWSHDPDQAARREAARRAGGRNRAGVIRMRKSATPALASLCNQLEGALTDTLEGAIEPRVASAAASLAGVLVRAYQVGEIETRLADLERRLKEYGP